MRFDANSKSSKAKRFRLIHEREAEDINSEIRHSRSYHHFFEGYSEEYVPKEDGKGRSIKRVYVGSYYKRNCSDRAWIAVKICYLLAFAAAVVLYALSASRPVLCNRLVYTSIPGLLSFVALLLVMSKLIACAAAKRVMVAYEFKYVFGRLLPFCAAAAGLLLLTSAMMFLCVMLNPAARNTENIIPALGCFVSAMIVIAIGVAEHKAEYTGINNTAQRSENGVVIQEEL